MARGASRASTELVRGEFGDLVHVSNSGLKGPAWWDLKEPYKNELAVKQSEKMEALFRDLPGLTERLRAKNALSPAAEEILKNAVQSYENGYREAEQILEVVDGFGDYLKREVSYEDKVDTFHPLWRRQRVAFSGMQEAAKAVQQVLLINSAGIEPDIRRALKEEYDWGKDVWPRTRFGEDSEIGK